MKKLLIAGALCSSLGATAQINLEKSYPNDQTMELVKLEADGYKYVGYNFQNNIMTIYNLDHSVWKSTSINSSIPAAATVYPRYVSKNLFDTDNDIEFLVGYYVTSGGNTVYTTLIFNENGTILKTLNDISSVSIENSGNGWKLIAGKQINNNLSNEVYSLPGQYINTGLKPSEEKAAETAIYPNPMEAAVTLRYTLPSGTQQANINIYTSNGVLARQMQVTNQFNEVLIQRGDLPAGNYYYQVTAPGVQPVSQQFVIR